MAATDELRRLLDERGVEWMGTDYTKPTQGHPTYTSLGEEYNNAEFIEYFDGNVLRLFDITPEQAIEATLGRGTCKDISEQSYFHPTFKCSECGFGIDDWFTSSGYPCDPSYCPNCGRKVVSE